MNADADIEPQLSVNNDVAQVSLFKANATDDNGGPVPWPQTPTRLALVDRQNQGLVHKLQVPFLAQNAWYFDGLRSVSPFFASFRKNELRHFKHVVVDSGFAGMDDSFHKSTESVVRHLDQWGRSDDNIFMRSLGDNLRFTVLLTEPAIDNETNQQAATQGFINKVCALRTFVEYCPKDQPLWTNFDGFEVAIHLNHNNKDRLVLSKGVELPVEWDMQSLADHRVIHHVLELIDVLHNRKSQRLHEQISFKPTDQELESAYFNSGLAINGLELTQGSRFAHGDPDTISSQYRPPSKFTRSVCKSYEGRRLAEGRRVNYVEKREWGTPGLDSN